MTHIEQHEEVILNHISGSLDDKNLDEALGLLRECKECREIYDNSLILRSEFRRTGIAHYLSTQAAATAAGAPADKSWTTHGWRPLAALAILTLALVLALLVYTNKSSQELREQLRATQADKERWLSELGALRQDSEELKSTVKELKEATEGADLRGPRPAPPPRDSSRPATAISDRPTRSFASPHTVSLALSELRDSEAPAAKPVVEVAFPPTADLLHLTLSISEESTYPRYRIVIMDGESKTTLQEYSDVKKDRFGNFNLFFTKNFFTRPDYRIKIFGVENGPAKLLAQQRIHLNF